MDAETDADALAGHVMAVIQGMSTLARDGGAREKLTRVAATAMLVWPAASSDRLVGVVLPGNTHQELQP